MSGADPALAGPRRARRGSPAPAQADPLAEPGGYLLDASVLLRLGSSPAIDARLSQLSAAHPLFCCPIPLLEYCFAAGNAAEYRELRADIDLLAPAPVPPETALVLDLQQALWERGLARAADAGRVLTAATAVANGLTLLTADPSYRHLATASGGGRLRIEVLGEEAPVGESATRQASSQAGPAAEALG